MSRIRYLAVLCALGAPLPLAAQQSIPVQLRFQLLKATQTKTADTSIRDIDAALKDVLRFPGYKLLSQAALTVDYSTAAKSPTMQRLAADGATYQLSVSIESLSGDGMQLDVKLWTVAPPASAAQLFGTRVSVAFGHTVILGSTQVAGSAGSTLVLAVKADRPQSRSVAASDGPKFYRAEDVDQRAEPLSMLVGVYPDSLKAQGISGSVRLRYVVGADGRVEEQSVEVMQSAHPGLEKAAVDAIRGQRYRAAVLKGEKVRQMVEQVMRFVPMAAPQASVPADVVTAAQVDQPVSIVNGPKAVYPAQLRSAGISGSVSLRYVVGVDGKVVPGSVQVVSSTNRAFEVPAIDAIQGSVFNPAVLKGSKVRQLVQQVVRFTPN
jgi:TonB family protein